MNELQAKLHVKIVARNLLEELQAINEQLRHTQEEARDFINEVEEVRGSVEPYEGKDKLTKEQVKRIEWYGELISQLHSVSGMDIEDTICDLDNFLDK